MIAAVGEVGSKFKQGSGRTSLRGETRRNRMKKKIGYLWKGVVKHQGESFKLEGRHGCAFLALQP